MKKLFSIAAIILAAHTVGLAQDEGMKDRSPRQRAEMQTARMEKKLHLTADQRAAILDINVKAAEKMTERGDKAKGAFREAQAEKDAAYRKVLTDEQFRQYEQMKKERMEAMKARRDGAAPADKQEN